VPELPEVEALALDLRGRLLDRAITRIDLAAFSALKTFDPPLHSLHGTLVEDVTRHGKFLDITASGTHLIMHLARAGWVRWRDEGRKQIKGVLRHQGTIAGIGNAYSDELLHAARMSPYKPSNGLSAEELQALYDAIRGVLGAAVERSRGLHASELKGEKKTNLAVHGRTGEKCPVCGDVVREVSFADSSLQYCATCQTGGKPPADRRLSQFLK